MKKTCIECGQVFEDSEEIREYCDKCYQLKKREKDEIINQLEIKLHEGTISSDEFLKLCIEKKFHGCSRDYIARELKITPKECRILLKQLIMERKAYKSYHSCVGNEYRFFSEDII